VGDFLESGYLEDGEANRRRTLIMYLTLQRGDVDGIVPGLCPIFGFSY
jgi:hypothetical protein